MEVKLSSGSRDETSNESWKVVPSPSPPAIERGIVRQNRRNSLRVPRRAPRLRMAL